MDRAFTTETSLKQQIAGEILKSLAFGTAISSSHIYGEVDMDITYCTGTVLLFFFYAYHTYVSRIEEATAARINKDSSFSC